MSPWLVLVDEPCGGTRVNLEPGSFDIRSSARRTLQLILHTGGFHATLFNRDGHVKSRKELLSNETLYYYRTAILLQCTTYDFCFAYQSLLVHGQ